MILPVPDMTLPCGACGAEPGEECLPMCICPGCDPDVHNDAPTALPSHDPSELLPGQTRAGLVITRAQLEAWTGRPMTPVLLAKLADALEHSTVPEAIASVVDGFTD